MTALFVFMVNAEESEPYAPNNLVCFAAFYSEESYLAGDAPFSEYTNDPDFCYEVVKSFPEGTYVVFYRDISYAEFGRIREYQSITLDLNGHTLTKCGKGDSSAPAMNCRFIIPEDLDQTLVIKNGKIINTEDNLFYTGSIYSAEYNYARGTVHFVDVEFEFPRNEDGKTSTPFDFRSGTIIMERCTVNAYGHQSIVSVGVDKDQRSFIMKDTVVNMTGADGNVCFFTHGNSARTVSAKVKIDVDGCEFNINNDGVDSLYSLQATGMLPEEASLDITVKNSKLNIPDSIFSFSAQINGFVPTVNYSNNLSVILPDFAAFSGEFIYPDGEQLIRIEYSETYLYHVTTPAFPTLYVNLTTEGYGLNIYVPKNDLIQKISIGRSSVYNQGLSYHTTDIGEQEYYVITYNSITDKNAAVMLDFEIRYTGENGLNYVCGFKYNVVKYIDDVLKTESEMAGSFDAEALKLVKSKAVSLYSAYDFFTDVVGSEEEIAYLKEVVESNGLW